MPKIQKVNGTTFEVVLPSGDKVEIGDRKSAHFKPHLKLNRWGGECFIKVGLPTAEKITPIVKAGRVQWRGQKVETHFYPLEPRTVIVKDKEGRDRQFTQNELGGFEFEIILKEKPATNQVVLNIETHGLKFYYQPPLTEKEIAGGAVRPDNGVGSYAVYHATRTPFHRSKADAEKYKCGKAFHIYRPKITDAEGNWAWGQLSLDKKTATLTITIRQDFLDKAIYPVSVDPTLGYTTAGAIWTTAATNQAIGSQIETVASSGGDIEKVSFYGRGSYGTINGKGFVTDSALAILTNGVTPSAEITDTGQWWDLPYTTKPVVSEGNTFYPFVVFDGFFDYYYDNGSGDNSWFDASNSYSSPSDPTDAESMEAKYSIYCYYEEAVEAPTVTTQAVSNIGTTTATGNGTIADTGGEDCSKRGVCWNTTGNPTVADDKSEETDSFGTGAFTRPMTGLSPATHYYVRAYAYNSEGYGYGTQVEFTTNKDCTGSDTGSGVDAKKTGEPKATYARSETGGGVDGHKAVAPQSAGETGEGVDALTALLGILARSETGLGTDAKLSLAVALIKADAGSGVEHILDRALVLISESGSGLDVSHLVKTLLLTESGTGAENSYLHILEGVKESYDSGSGAEASSLAALLQRDEAGEGADAVAARALFSREPQMGAIDLARVITAAITGAETGTGAEASLLAYYQKKADSGEGVDSSTLEALFTGEDSGAGAEAITLLAAMVAQDTGVAVEAVLTYLRTLVDSGEGEEVVNIVGAVGRAMKLITYLRAYSDLTVYTKPYSDLRVYTSEVKKE